MTEIVRIGTGIATTTATKNGSETGKETETEIVTVTAIAGTAVTGTATGGTRVCPRRRLVLLVPYTSRFFFLGRVRRTDHWEPEERRNGEVGFSMLFASRED